jgi:hypothetical protein
MRQPIHARMIDANTISHGGVKLTSVDPIKSMCRRLVADGYDPAMSLQIWKGAQPWRLVFAIGQPDSHVKLKAKNGGNSA